MEISGKIKLLKNSQTDANGVAIAPLPTELEHGQIAVNYSATNPCIFIKDSNNKIIKFATEEIVADTLAEILGGSAADLSTLKELLEAFGNSDIATTQASILTRLSAVESGKVDKVAGKGLSTNDFTNADKAHISSTTNPHGVTKTQVGLGNLRNVEQLGKTETAVNADKLGNIPAANYWHNANSNIPTVDWNCRNLKSHGNITIGANNNNRCKLDVQGYDSYAIIGQTKGDGEGKSNKLRLGLATTEHSGSQYWCFSVDDNLSVPGDSLLRVGYDMNKTAISISASRKVGINKINPLHILDVGGTVAATNMIINDSQVYHAGNSNKADVDWVAKEMYAQTYRGSKVSGALTRLIGSHGIGADKAGGSVQIFAGQGTGNGGCGDIEFYTANKGSVSGETGASTTRRLTIKNTTGNVGIGTESPTANLHISNKSTSCVLRLESKLGQCSLSNNISDGSVKLWNHSNTDMVFGTNDLGRMTISKNGRVGIGIGAPTEKLDVNGNGKFSGNVVAKGDVVAYSQSSNIYIDPVAGGASYLFDLSDVELPASLTNNYVLAYDSKKQKWTAKESLGTGGALVDYGRLSNIPTSFTPCAHNHEDATYVSDSRLKQNIEPLNNALSTILSLQGKSFGWTSEARNRYRMKDEVSYGYIAQDVQKVLPHVVKELETGDGYIGVEYIKLIPYLSEAIRELHENTIESNITLKKELAKMNKVYSKLVTENQELKSKFESLEQRLAEIESKLNI